MDDRVDDASERRRPRRRRATPGVSEGRPQAGYRAALRHPVVRMLWSATLVSTLGDYVGQGALLIMAHERSGGLVLGSAAVFATGAIPALLSGALAGTWLDRVPRGRALTMLQIVGAFAIVIPLLLPGLAPVLLAAGILGAVRAASVSVRSGAMAEGVPDEHRGPLLGLLGTTEQSAQVVGYLAGASLFVLIGEAPALLLDAASFLVGAALLARAPFPPPRERDRRPSITEGFRDIWRDPVLRMLAPLVWVAASVASVPEALATGVASDGSPWLPFVLAAAPAGQAITLLLLGRTRHLGRPSVQLTHLAWQSLAFGIAALGRTPAWFAVSNLLVGSGVAWTIGPQLTFVRLAPQERMAQVTGTMIALIVAADGLGTPLFGAIADRTSVATAYRVAGFMVLAIAVIGWSIKERTPAARALDRPDPDEPAGADA